MIRRPRRSGVPVHRCSKLAIGAAELLEQHIAKVGIRFIDRVHEFAEILRRQHLLGEAPRSCIVFHPATMSTVDCRRLPRAQCETAR